MNDQTQPKQRQPQKAKYRKTSRNVYYSLLDAHFMNLYREVAAHLNEAKV